MLANLCSYLGPERSCLWAAGKRYGALFAHANSIWKVGSLLHHKSELVRINANVKRYPGARVPYAAV